MKKILFTILIIISVMYFAACTNTGTNTNNNQQNNQDTTRLLCTDSDNSNAYSKGSVVDTSGKTYTDGCSDAKTVNEAICGTDQKVSFINIACKTGETCKDGVCLSDVTTTNALGSCTDSDEGVDENTVGYVQDKSGGVYKDSCLNTNTVKEAICGDAGYKDYTNVECTSGKICQNGACITGAIAQSACTDSDLLDEFTKGTVTDKAKKTYSDECLNTRTLIEYKCGIAEYAEKKYVECASGCLDGACVK